ncbi:proline-rich protein HaeIII subfamily 1-like [Pseudopipra pipra]|uniref:proline-rich protein HaeIII subfamily 1-like n=1 Tax=Pseudopipra pipra TaxID=415032 RepID=UPI0031387597
MSSSSRRHSPLAHDQTLPGIAKSPEHPRRGSRGVPILPPRPVRPSIHPSVPAGMPQRGLSQRQRRAVAATSPAVTRAAEPAGPSPGGGRASSPVGAPSPLANAAAAGAGQGLPAARRGMEWHNTMPPSWLGRHTSGRQLRTGQLGAAVSAQPEPLRSPGCAPAATRIAQGRVGAAEGPCRGARRTQHTWQRGAPPPSPPRPGGPVPRPAPPEGPPALAGVQPGSDAEECGGAAGGMGPGRRGGGPLACTPVLAEGPAPGGGSCPRLPRREELPHSIAPLSPHPPAPWRGPSSPVGGPCLSIRLLPPLWGLTRPLGQGHPPEPLRPRGPPHSGVPALWGVFSLSPTAGPAHGVSPP